MAVVIETASMRCLDELCEVETKCFKDEAFTRKEIASLIADYDSIALVARVNNSVAGFVIAMIETEENAMVGHILTIDVMPQHQRMGVGLRLLREIERTLKEKSIKKCYLEVREDNRSALSLYDKAGYERIGRLRRYYGKTDGLCLAKTLSQSK